MTMFWKSENPSDQKAAWTSIKISQPTAETTDTVIGTSKPVGFVRQLTPDALSPRIPRHNKKAIVGVSGSLSGFPFSPRI